MKHIRRTSAAAVINQLVRFDTHMVEKHMLRFYTVEFGQELIDFAHTRDPYHQFSAHFAKWLDRTFSGQIRKTSKVTSENLGGEQSENQQWDRIVPRVA